jgi:hypothetical protein
MTNFVSPIWFPSPWDIWWILWLNILWSLRCRITFLWSVTVTAEEKLGESGTWRNFEGFLGGLVTASIFRRKPLWFVVFLSWIVKWACIIYNSVRMYVYIYYTHILNRWPLHDYSCNNQRVQAVQEVLKLLDGLIQRATLQWNNLFTVSVSTIGLFDHGEFTQWMAKQPN